MARIYLILVTGLLSACSGMDTEQYTELDEQDRAEILKLDDRLNNLHFEIVTMAQQGTCDADAQCQTFALGEKPCGGPRYYYAHSITDMNNSVLMSKVAEYNRLDKEKNIKLKASVANCYVETDPGARCSAGRCISP